MDYPATPTFWIDPAGYTARGARRYVGCDRYGVRCADGRVYHDAITWIDEVKTVTKIDLDGTRVRREVPALDPAADYWPLICDYCSYVFDTSAPKQTFSEEVFRRADGSLYTLPDYVGDSPPNTTKAPPGAMYHAYWHPSSWRGEDGISLIVVLPNSRTWSVDMYASNCTRPGQPHKCWVRHGDPRRGDVTVDKDGDTCNAGAGSILSGDYHGFLVKGVLSSA